MNIIKNVKIVNACETIENGYVIFEDNRIVEVGKDYIKDDGIDAQGQILMPGFIDIHVHGAMDKDAMDCSDETLDVLEEYMPSEGVTSYLATTLTVDIEELKKAVDVVANHAYKGGAKVIGVHLEGPFIDETFKGAQNSKYILAPTKKHLDYIVGENKGTIKTLTYAVEKADVEFTKCLVSRNIIPSVGHSAASFEDVMKHVDAGLNKVTHFHNGQSAHHHRKPGVVSATLYSDDLYAELICDGIHVHPDAVKVSYKVKGADRIVLITDGLSAKGMPDGAYELGGQPITKKGDEIRLENGALAGSALKMNGAAKNIMKFTGCGLNDIVKMASLNQAKLLKRDDELGTIAKGYLADMVLLNPDMSVAKTVCEGRIFEFDNKEEVAGK